MPLYTYVCLSCKKETEDLRSIEEADRPGLCPFCKNVQVRKCYEVPAKAIWRCSCPTHSGGK